MSVRDYGSWRGYGESGPYHCMNIGHRFLHKLVDHTERMLRAMRLTGTYMMKEHSRAGDQIVMDGKVFETPPVHIFECLSTEPWGYQDRWEEDLGGDPFLTALKLLTP